MIDGARPSSNAMAEFDPVIRAETRHDESARTAGA